MFIRPDRALLMVLASGETDGRGRTLLLLLPLLASPTLDEFHRNSWLRSVRPTHCNNVLFFGDIPFIHDWDSTLCDLFVGGWPVEAGGNLISIQIYGTPLHAACANPVQACGLAHLTKDFADSPSSESGLGLRPPPSDLSSYAQCDLSFLH